jgi:hypothetical protein
MEVTVTISGLNPRQQAWAAEVLDDINVGRLQNDQDAFPTLAAWAVDNIKINLRSMFKNKDAVRAEIRKEQWITATDEQRAAVDAALGVE